MATFNVNGAINTTNPFFQSLGTNGRTCATCHVVSDAMSLSAADAQARFASSGGTDPLFAPVDGANCPNAVTGDASEHSLLINNGLIRIPMPVPNGAQFSLEVVHDPYGCALTTDPSTGQEVVSIYRRPLPATNLNFLSAVMFDGRETISPLNNSSTFAANLATDLAHQALDATLGHAQAATAPTSAQLSAIVNFERGLFSAQAVDNNAGRLDAQGARGGPYYLSQSPYYPGINDSLGSNPTGAAFNPQVFTIFATWQSLASGEQDQYTSAREAVAAGEEIFNTSPLQITNVKGLNNVLGLPTIVGTCSTCHDTPNVGDHSLPVPLDIGTSHDLDHETDSQIAAALAELSIPDLPVFQITCLAGPLAGQVSYTSDPAKALISGLCSDIGRGKGPILRGLAARAPYFHNGAARSLTEVVNFYNQRFQMGLTDEQKQQLVAFLQSL